uniref:Palmitoyltransferase n=1 Tax=Arcella intermedia TaxID=1963864 RepID=A0A6B2LC21_9EUKA
MIHGPDRRYFWISSLTLILTGILFLTIICPKLYHSSVLGSGWKEGFIVVFLYIWLYSVVTHFIVAYTDPGIIPRQEPPPYKLPNQKKLNVQGETILIRWCPTCNIYRPPRAVHCGICDNCVARFDHHCPYVGNCIGQRNYRYFLLFIASTLLSALFLLSHNAYYLSLSIHRTGLSEAFFSDPLLYVFLWATSLVALIASILLGILVGFTGFLVSCARTTNENIKQTFFNVGNPYSRGCLGNWVLSLCPPSYPPSLRPREFQAVEDIETEDEILEVNSS